MTWLAKQYSFKNSVPSNGDAFSINNIVLTTKCVFESVGRKCCDLSNFKNFLWLIILWVFSYVQLWIGSRYAHQQHRAFQIRESSAARGNSLPAERYSLCPFRAPTKYLRLDWNLLRAPNIKNLHWHGARSTLIVIVYKILVSMHCLPKKNWAQCFHTILVHMRFLQKQMPSYKIPWGM